MDFESIYQSCFTDVFLYLRSLSSNGDIAEELTQETFSKALRAIDRFDGKTDIRAWLFTIAKNAYISYLRKQKHMSQSDFPQDVPDSRTHFSESIADEASAFLIHRFLHDMKEPYKEVFTLRVFGELSFEKIGALFSKSDGWARVTYYRARKQIIDYMEEIENGKSTL